MKTLLVLSAVCLAGTSAFALPDYDPFANATGSGGTSYAIGSNLIGQTNAAGQYWSQAGPGGTNTQPTIVAGDLSVPGLASAGGGAGVGFGGSGTSARFNLGSTINSGTIYFSFAMQLTDLSALSTGGIFWAGFNNSTGSQTSTPNTVGTRVVTRSAGAGLFNIGLDKSSGSAASFQWFAQNFTTSDTIFLVGSYTFNTASTSDDLSQLWVNPNSSTFGLGSAPTASLMSTAGTDLGSIASWVLFERNAGEPTGGEIDDLRIGTSWADVTPTTVPEPSPVTFGLLGLLGLVTFRAWRR